MKTTKTPGTNGDVHRLEKENADLKKRVAELEAEKVQLFYELARRRFSEKDWEDFDPKDYTVPGQELLADMDALQKESSES